MAWRTTLVLVFGLMMATGPGPRADECFCLTNPATGATVRGCEAYKAPTDYYSTAVCTDPETGRKSEQTMSPEWQRIEDGFDRCNPCRRASQSAEQEVPRGSPLATASRVVTASRIFAGPNQYPPMEFAAYGILAFRSRPSPYDRDRHLLFCNAYVATLPHESELEVPRSKQMVTVWPVNSDEYSNRLNQLVDRSRDICQIAVDHYGLVIAQQTLRDAELTGENVTASGPFLLAWSPATDKGREGALFLVSDLSNITTYEQARERLGAWSRDIERDPTLWIKGWNREGLRIAIRDWVDKYGARSLAVFGIKG
jgi:hypothetical protein